MATNLNLNRRGAPGSGCQASTFGNKSMDSIRIKSPESDFTFTIKDGELSAIGKIYLQGRQEFSFPIAEMNPKPNVLERRAPAFRQGVATFGLAI